MSRMLGYCDKADVGGCGCVGICRIGTKGMAEPQIDVRAQL
jgi:hypothetical protein